MELLTRIPGDKLKVGRRPMRVQISDKLAYMIHSGLLRPGDELPSERELATTLGVSRESVRGAIGALQTAGMLEVSQGARTKVVGPGSLALHESVSTLGDLKHRSFEEVAEARAAVELQVVRLAAQRIQPGELTRLQTLVDDQQSMLDDPVRFQISDQQFHETVYGACRNALLADVLFDFYGYAQDSRRRALKRPGAIAESVADHRAIVAALRSGHAPQAVEAMHQHLERVRRTTLVELTR